MKLFVDENCLNSSFFYLNSTLKYIYSYWSIRNCHENNLVKPLSYKTWGQNCFISHCVDDWNSLPEHIRTLPFNSFKIAISNS